MPSSNRIPGLWALRKTPSVYGGAGGYGTRVSRASTSVFRADDVLTDPKETMKNLNDRLAYYLDQVRALESSNKKWELQIREHCENMGHSEARDNTAYLTLIANLRNKISNQQLENQSIFFQMNDVQLSADNFKLKGDKEMNLRCSVEADVSHLRKVRDGLTMTTSDLELQIEGLKEELFYMKKNHEEEMHLLREQQGGSVNVEMNNAQCMDLTKALSEVRLQYERLMEKNKSELQSWFLTKVETFNTVSTTTTVEENSFHSELSELKKTYQSYEISRESLLREMSHWQQTMEEVQSRFGVQLTQLQMNINALEAELGQLRVSMETQQFEYSALLDLKMRLELEIEEYRRLLGAELEKKTVIISKVEEKVVEEHKPHIERRTKTIIEEIVDGVVVTHKVETQVEDIQ
uniref:Keratin 99 n=1 Tax=Neogobius melanostomus TaxID=47308 RepID=A0A8C6WQ67_9GOBI